MNIYDLTNEELAHVLESMAQHKNFANWTLYGFKDNKDLQYQAVRFIQEAASRLAKMKDEEPDSEETPSDGDGFFSVTKTTKTEEVVQKPEPEKPEEEPEPSTVEVLKQAVKMLAEAGRRESKSPMAYDTYGKVIELMRKLDREKQA